MAEQGRVLIRSHEVQLKRSENELARARQTSVASSSQRTSYRSYEEGAHPCHIQNEQVKSVGRRFGKQIWIFLWICAKE